MAMSIAALLEAAEFLERRDRGELVFVYLFNTLFSYRYVITRVIVAPMFALSTVTVRAWLPSKVK